MNGAENIEEILIEHDETQYTPEEWENVHAQTWHDSWRNSHGK